MAKKRQKPGLPSRRKRFTRTQRLQAATAWLESDQGKKMARSYRRRYRVDWQTAFTVLEMLAVAIDPECKLVHQVAPRGTFVKPKPY